jgi:hypothetical protein
LTNQSRALLPTKTAQRCTATLALLVAASNAACGGVDHSAPAPAADATADMASAPSGSAENHAETQRPVQTTSITQTAGNPEQGLLDLFAIGSAEQSLGSLSFVVRNPAGAVLSRGFNDVLGRDVDRHLLLQLSAGVDYQLDLDSASHDDHSLKCHASVGPFSISADTTASYQAFIWQCDGGSPAPAPADSCYWLTDFVGVSRTRAAVGETIDLRVSGFDTTGAPARVTWSVQASQYGSISEKHAAQTTFRCDAASDVVPLFAVVTGDGCSRRIQVNVACY